MRTAHSSPKWSLTRIWHRSAKGLGYQSAHCMAFSVDSGTCLGHDLWWDDGGSLSPTQARLLIVPHGVLSPVEDQHSNNTNAIVLWQAGWVAVWWGMGDRKVSRKC